MTSMTWNKRTRSAVPAVCSLGGGQNTVLHRNPRPLSTQPESSGKEMRQRAREEKKSLYLGREGGHQWVRKGRGLQCQRCKKQVHQRMPMVQLRQAKDEQRGVEVRASLTGGNSAADSKQAHIKGIVAERPVEGHLLQLQANYIVCQKVRVLKNSAREKIAQLHKSECWYGQWTPPSQWVGNPSHIMWRKGQKIYCQTCKAYAVNKGT